MIDEFLSTAQVAKRFGVSRVTVFNMIKAGRLPAHKVGRSYVVLKKDIEGLIDDSIKKKILPILQKYHIKRAGIFGSFACASQKKKSDLDILAEFPKRASLLDLIGLQQELAGILQRKVDVITYNSLRHPILKERILGQEIKIL